ncbi:aldo/keto reductase [Leucobacter coleopterorum]|uniref:Aldo/keto reductase n=1 Tax=Leucobacter coleopterorum TaxID=2714933 RepID=A0ABX6JXL6_9MICO|nr:aldo/keto reductase [Leucobacter coleopterorum]QIM19046.1 aldo/keto reductase [Leucobacter coleopterorum]
MEQRQLGHSPKLASVVGLGTWQLGADWGDVSEADAFTVLETAAAGGVTFFDTADVYGDGRSEQLIGRFLDSNNLRERITVATKMGRRQEQVPENYILENFRQWIDRSRVNLGVDQLDLVQLHCPPSAVYSSTVVYDALDTLVEEGAITNYGVSVETAAEALEAIKHPGVATVQLIANAFRLKAFDQVIPQAAAAGVGIIARVPLASGLLSGRYSETTTFAENDHRTYNRAGEAFDVGETFSGVEFPTGIAAAREFSALVSELAPAGTSPSQAAIAWLWQQPGITTAIPGARNSEQALANAQAGQMPELGDRFTAGVRDIYDRLIRSSVHGRW